MINTDDKKQTKTPTRHGSDNALTEEVGTTPKSKVKINRIQANNRLTFKMLFTVIFEISTFESLANFSCFKFEFTLFTNKYVLNKEYIATNANEIIVDISTGILVTPMIEIVIIMSNKYINNDKNPAVVPCLIHIYINTTRIPTSTASTVDVKTLV